MELFLTTAKRSFDAGLLPVMRTFILCGQTGNGGRRGDNSFDCIYRMDIGSVTTTVYPMDYSGREPRNTWLMHFDPVRNEELEYLGRCEELVKIVEGAETWLEATHGARLPPCLKDSVHCHWRPTANVRIIRNDISRRTGSKASLLRQREEKAKRRLLKVQTRHGLRLPGCPIYDVFKYEVGADNDIISNT
ncbi:hypothetical protein OHC33_004863 [Knufia fluminis]|uniref:Uncharacterized protein n=1 Tax=Knufia fluminis TaxID=191047 RepID=A0AAN8I9G0_9EURO|nr:hypothetical protein OHC33_004863 [Knufia fluminis]